MLAEAKDPEDVDGSGGVMGWSSSRVPLRRWKVVCAYDGTEFEGWQSQPNGKAIQDFIERRLQAIFDRPVRIAGSGRTDSGVHARGQVFHFDAAWKSRPEHMLRAMQVGYPDSLRMLSLREVPMSFDARRSAVGKRYSYRIFEGFALPQDTRFCWSTGRMKLDVESMQSAAALLVGERDFASFAANRGKPYASTVRHLRILDVRRTGRFISIRAEANGFMYKMVRSLAGVLIDVGRGKLAPPDARRLLEMRSRSEWVVTAPAKGLTLEKVYYRRPKGWDVDGAAQLCEGVEDE